MRQRFGAVGKQGSIAVVELPAHAQARVHARRGVGAVVAACFVPGITTLQQLVQRGAAAHDPDGSDTQRSVLCSAACMPDAPFRTTPSLASGLPCAKPQVLVKGQPGVVLEVGVTFQTGRRHLPQIILNRAA
jgi:hypothetical protein